MGQRNSMWPCRGSSVDTKLSKCSNSGALTINASGLDSKSSDISAFGIISGNTKKVTSCKNSGKITVKVKNCNSSSLTDGITVAGLCEVAEKLTFCSNTGKISLESCDIRGEIGVAGITYGFQMLQHRFYNCVYRQIQRPQLQGCRRLDRQRSKFR